MCGRKGKKKRRERKKESWESFWGEKKAGGQDDPETHLGHKYFHAEFSPVGVSALDQSPSSSCPLSVSPRLSVCFLPSLTTPDGLIGFVRVMAQLAFVLVQPIIQGPCRPRSSVEPTD